MGEAAAPALAVAKSMLMLCRSRRSPDIGSVVHPAPSYDHISTGTLSSPSIVSRKGVGYLLARSATFRPSCLPSIGNVIVVGNDA